MQRAAAGQKFTTLRVTPSQAAGQPGEPGSYTTLLCAQAFLGDDVMFPGLGGIPLL